MSGAFRRALCVGVGSFKPVGADDRDEPDLFEPEPLPFAAKLTRELHEALLNADYDSDCVVDGGDLKADELGKRVKQHLGGGGVAVVHVLSHGDLTQAGGVYVVGSDGARSMSTRVEEWRIAVTDDPSAPMTLFLLDLCHAGAANRHWQPPASGAQERAWVIAAASADQLAWEGRLTRAAATVINRITSGEFDLASTERYVRFNMFFHLIRTEVNTLADAKHGHRQHVRATSVEAGELPELPFFRNPGYQPNPVAEAATAVEPVTAPFLDPALDEDHFRDRAAGQGPAASRITVGCFTGRAPQLRHLSAWMDGAGDGGVTVVTGSPGAGKSALLGLLVCAAHPDLRGATHDLWRAAAARPSMNPELAAVHARQRTLSVILRSLTAQLHLDPELDRPVRVIEAITQRVSSPVVVIDAVDEALDHQQLVDQLLIPLARARRSDGAPACRLLIGMRPWQEFESLLSLAQRIGEVIDLDAIPANERRRDVADYVAGLLELLPRYDVATYRGGRRVFAEAVAATLVNDETATMRWGEFLVASLYAHTISLNRPDQLTDAIDAERLGASVPRTLPEVLDLDLAARPPSRWSRAVLTTLAHAHGGGIPRSVLPAVAMAITGQPAAPSVEQVAEELDALRFYLRTSVDTDGSTLYRLFHQGLADHLRGGRDGDPVSTVGQVLDGLLATIPMVQGVRSWDLAEPYLIRHAVQHAADAGRVDELLVDPEFLVHADPATLIPALRLADGAQARLAAGVYRVSAGEHPCRSHDQRRDVLAIDAARYGDSVLIDGLVSSPATTRPGWQPRWATGGQVNPALRATFPGDTNRDWVMAVACTQLDGRPVAVTGCYDNKVRIRDLTTGAQIGDALPGHTGAVKAVACARLDGQPVAVTGGQDGMVRVWDLTTRTQIGDALPGHIGAVEALACSQLGDLPVAVTAGVDAMVQVWDLTTRTRIGDWPTGHTGAVKAVACARLDGQPVAVTGSQDDTVRVLDLATGTQIGELTGHTSWVVAVACAQLDGHPVAVTGSQDITVRVWDLTARTQLGDALPGHTGAVEAVACAQIDGRSVAVTAGMDATVRVWDLTTRTQIGYWSTGHTGQVKAVACTRLDGQSVAVTVSADAMVRVWELPTGTQIGGPLPGEALALACGQLGSQTVAVTADRGTSVQVWDLAAGSAIGEPLTGHTRPVGAVACAQLDGRPVGVAAGWDGTMRVWDLSDGTPIGRSHTGHTDWVKAVACTTLSGLPIAVTGSRDNMVRIWDLAAAAPIGDPLTGHTSWVDAVACTRLDSRPVAVTGSWDRTVRIWNLEMRCEIDRINLPSDVRAIDATAAGQIVAAFGWDIVVLERTSEGKP